MPPEGKSRKTERVDQKVMQDTSTPRPEAPGVARSRSPGARKEDWIASQLRRVYDDALHEAIPKEMMDLLNALDDGDQDESDKEDRE
jgi:hypothetical protein